MVNRLQELCAQIAYQQEAHILNQAVPDKSIALDAGRHCLCCHNSPLCLEFVRVFGKDRSSM